MNILYEAPWEINFRFGPLTLGYCLKSWALPLYLSWSYDWQKFVSITFLCFLIEYQWEMERPEVDTLTKSILENVK